MLLDAQGRTRTTVSWKMRCKALAAACVEGFSRENQGGFGLFGGLRGIPWPQWYTGLPF